MLENEILSETDIDTKIKSVQRAVLFLGYIFGKYKYNKGLVIWIYPNDDFRVLKECLDLHDIFRKRKNRNVILIREDIPEEIIIPSEIQVEIVEKIVITDLVNWYAMCSPYPNDYYMLSLKQPAGREGEKWINNFERISIRTACGTGILRLNIDEY